MPRANVLYDPNWEAVHDHHAAERQRLSKLLFGARCDRLSGAAAVEARAAFDLHHMACLRTFEAQYETVQEYAQWRFSLWTADGPRPAVDYEALRSVEEVRNLCMRLETEADEVEHADRVSLPVGQPLTLQAFEGEGVVRCWHHFTPDELRSCGETSIAGTRTLMTPHWLAGVWHVCFMQDETYPGKSVINAIETLATLVYHEARAEAEAWRSQRRGWGGRLGRLVSARLWRWTVRPSSFQFYTHLPPKRPSSEDFDRVELRGSRPDGSRPRAGGAIARSRKRSPQHGARSPTFGRRG